MVNSQAPPCTCSICRTGIAGQILEAIHSAGGPCGPYTIRAAARLGWMPWPLYLATLERLVAARVLDTVPATDPRVDYVRYVAGDGGCS